MQNAVWGMTGCSYAVWVITAWIAECSVGYDCMDAVMQCGV